MPGGADVRALGWPSLARGVRAVMRHDSRESPTRHEGPPPPGRLAFLQVGTSAPGPASGPAEGPVLLVAALPGGTALSWLVHPRRTWHRPPKSTAIGVDPQPPREVAVELEAELRGLDLVSRKAACMTLWLDALFEAAGRTRPFEVTDVREFGRLGETGLRQTTIQVGTVDGYLQQQVLFAQLSLESLALVHRGARAPTTSPASGRPGKGTNRTGDDRP